MAKTPLKSTPLAMLATLLMVAISPAAIASCYSVYDGTNKLIFQDTHNPVEMHTQLADAVKSRFGANAHMVFMPSETGCDTVKPEAVGDTVSTEKKPLGNEQKPVH